MTAQFVAAQQRVAELTPLAEEADSLRSRVAEACRHADEAERAFEALSARSWRDDEEAAKVRKEWDELLQKDAKTHQRILDLLAKVEKERGLKLGGQGEARGPGEEGKSRCRGGRPAAQGAG